MAPRDQDRVKMTRALRDLLLETPESELREIVSENGQSFDDLAARGRAAAQRALASTVQDTAQIEDLHRGLGALIQMLRRRDRLSIEKLAAGARIDVAELRAIETEPSFEPNPRTVYQLEQYFKMPSRSLVVLSGAVHVEDDVRDEAVRFAASSTDMSTLSREEKKLLNRFVKFLRQHTD